MKRRGSFLEKGSIQPILTVGILLGGVSFAILATRSGTPDRAPAQTGEYGLIEYVNDCERELGTIPTFGCFQGEAIPVVNSDLPQSGPHGAHPLEITDQNYTGNGQMCDSPSQLQEDNFIIREVARLAPCVPYTRLGTSPAQPGFATKWVWSCRRYFPRPENDWHFDDINMIGHNPETGATCYFVTNINRFLPAHGEDQGNNGQYVPSPAVARADTPAGRYARRLWKTPDMMTNRKSWQGGSMQCTFCHDNDPFIHTPFVQQMLKPDGSPVVPSYPNGPYWMVGDPRFYGDPQWMTSGGPRGWQVRRLVSPEASACTMCHSLGDQRTCNDLARWSTGVEHHSRTTQFARQFHWMPPSGGRTWQHALGEAPHAPITQDQREAVDFINHCCKHPNDPRCIWRAPPAPRPRRGVASAHP